MNRKLNNFAGLAMGIVFFIAVLFVAAYKNNLIKTNDTKNPIKMENTKPEQSQKKQAVILLMEVDAKKGVYNAVKTVKYGDDYERAKWQFGELKDEHEQTASLPRGQYWGHKVMLCIGDKKEGAFHCDKSPEFFIAK